MPYRGHFLFPSLNPGATRLPTKYAHTIDLPSDGKPIEVKILGIWELDDQVPITFDEVFTYRIKSVTGEEYAATLDLSKFTEIPEPPDIPQEQCVKGGSEWHDWSNYHAYQAAVEHRAEMVRRQDKWMKDITKYVVKRCLAPEDRGRVADINDHNAGLRAAVTPKVTKEALAETLRRTFPG
jgi:hypothetical protein